MAYLVNDVLRTPYPREYKVLSGPHATNDARTKVYAVRDSQDGTVVLLPERLLDGMKLAV